MEYRNDGKRVRYASAYFVRLDISLKKLGAAFNSRMKGVYQSEIVKTKYINDAETCQKLLGVVMIWNIRNSS